MKTLDFTLDEDNPAHPAIGLVVLQSDETLEHELRQWLPAHYRLFHTRIPNDQTIDSQSLQDMQNRLPESVALLPANTNYRVIAYGCTSASTVIGEAAVTKAIQSVFPNCAVTNPISAVKTQLKHVNAKRIAVLTPYEPAVSAALLANLETDGYQIVHTGSFNETADHRVARISQVSLNTAIDQLGAERDIDALFASCTNLRTLDLIEAASERIACPVISSNSALAWHIRQLVSIYHGQQARYHR